MTPDEVRCADIALLQQEGLRVSAILDAIYVCIGFNVIVRIADALEFTVPPPEVFDRSAKYLLLFGYKLLSGMRFVGGLANISDDDYRSESAKSVGGDLIHDPYEPGIRLLQKSIVTGPGTLAPEIRDAVMCSASLPEKELGTYVSRVRHCAWEITDGDIETLKKANYSEDQIFELTVCAAVGAGLARLEKGLGALRETIQ